MKRISVFVVGLALMFAGSAVAQTLPVPLPPVPTVPPLPLPPVPTVPPAGSSPLPGVEAPALPSVPAPGSTAPSPAAPTQTVGSRGGNASVRGSSGAGVGSTGARTSPSGGPAARGSLVAATGRRGRAEPRVVRRERRLRSTVRRFEGCLGGLTALQRRVLVLRAGLGEEHRHTRSSVARILDLDTRRVGRVERSGLRRLRALGRGGSCGTAPAMAVGDGVPAPASVAAAPRLWARLPGDLALPLGRIEVKGERDSSSSHEPPLAEAPEAAVPPVGQVVTRKRDGGGVVDVTLPLLLVLVIAAIAVAVRSTVRALRAD